MMQLHKSLCMDRWIKTYPKIFDNSECIALIDYFEGLKDKWEETKTAGHRQFWEVNLMDNGGLSDMNLLIYDRYKQVLANYKEDVELHPKQWPEKYAWEALRLKKYESNVGHFLDHVDVGNYDTARRFLVFFTYLNTVNKGGETEFVNLDLQVTPECGTVLVFPATWDFPHRGNIPVDQDKYILGTYLHYV